MPEPACLEATLAALFERELNLVVSSFDLDLFGSISRLAKFIAPRLGQDDTFPWKYAS